MFHFTFTVPGVVPVTTWLKRANNWCLRQSTDDLSDTHRHRHRRDTTSVRNQIMLTTDTDAFGRNSSSRVKWKWRGRSLGDCWHLWAFSLFFFRRDSSTAEQQKAANERSSGQERMGAVGRPFHYSTPPGPHPHLQATLLGDNGRATRLYNFTWVMSKGESFVYSQFGRWWTWEEDMLKHRPGSFVPFLSGFKYSTMSWTTSSCMKLSCVFVNWPDMSLAVLSLMLLSVVPWCNG